MRAPFSVGVFCGSRFGARDEFAEAAQMLGTSIGREGWRLVYGGGEVGLMGVTARAVMAAGGEVLGVIPQRLLDREVGKRDITELRVTETMFERKALLIQESDAFVALPGGLGTLDEILDVVTLRQLGYHDKSILLLDLDGFWRGTHAAFQQLVAEGFAERSALGLYELAPDIDTLMDRLRAAAGGPRF